MPKRISATIALALYEEQLAEILQKFFSQDGLPRKPLRLKSSDPDWGADELGSFLEWRLLPAHLRLDPSWPHHDVWCDGVSFFSLEIPQPNLLCARGYSWWLPTDQDGAGKMSGIEGTQPIELEMRLIDDGPQPRVDYSIRLWADGLCHHITPSGVAIAPLHSEAAIQPDLDGLLAAIKGLEIDTEEAATTDEILIHSIAESAASVMETFAPPGALLLTELLNDSNTEVRRTAIRGLGWHKPAMRFVAPLAVKALSDDDFEVRCLAMEVLWRCARAGEAFLPDLKLARPVLLEMFGHEFDYYRNSQLDESLAQLGQSDQIIVEAMVEALSKEQTRLRAAWVLWSIGSLPETASPIFTAALNSEDQEWRVYAAFSLWRFGVDGGKAFIRLAGDIENVEASRAVDTLLSVDSKAPLKLLHAEAAAPVLTAILEERKANARVWSQAALALGQIYSRETDESSRRLLLSIEPTLVKLLKYDDWSIRCRAIEALGAMGADAKPALPALLAIVRDHEHDSLLREYDSLLRGKAAEALIKIGPDADAVVSLFDLMRWEEGHGLYSNAIPMIKLLGDQAAPTLVKTLLAIKPDDEIPLLFDYKAFELLGEIGPAALPGLIELSNSKRWRYSALEALGKAGAVAVPILLDALKGEEIKERATAAEALGEIGPPAAPAISALGEALNDADLEVCARVAEALGRIGPASVPTLIEALKDADPFTLCWVAKAIGEIGAEAGTAIPALIELRLHTNPTVRYFTSEALKKIGWIEETV